MVYLFLIITRLNTSGIWLSVGIFITSRKNKTKIYRSKETSYSVFRGVEIPCMICPDLVRKVRNFNLLVLGQVHQNAKES